MATSAIESIGSTTKEAPRKRGRFSTTLGGALAVIALSATGAAVTSAATESRAEPQIETATRPRPESTPKQQTQEQQTAITPGGGSLPPESMRVIADEQIQKIVTFVKAQEAIQVGNYIASQIAQEEADRQAQAALAQQAVQREAQPSRVTFNDTSGDFLSCVVGQESGGIVNIYNSEGSGASGLFQDMQGTWQNAAANSGVAGATQYANAADAPVDIQWAVNEWLYATEGKEPWRGDPCY